MNYRIDVQNVCGDGAKFSVPTRTQIRHWIGTVLVEFYPKAELTVRTVDKSESTELNERYRRKHGATNILSFPFEHPEACSVPLLGDLVICAPLVLEEAHAQNKAIEAHWAHLIIHGTLHLLGYDHQNDAEAAIMESKEIAILADLNYPNPYLTGNS